MSSLDNDGFFNKGVKTGLLLFMSSLDNVDFFNKGVMCDTFKTSGKESESKDKWHCSWWELAIHLGKILIIW